ncbi:2'-5' RNA ligase family protein [Sphingomonas sp. BN140010]|uniref:2'-5' RNA ligase family protein n=1 Tax=Sphingomonas arvum TaxID=2992113 RepID=A0ABT3JD62_9SPHN|nr:2'-5' RNA ligase family protein [Sphingomonas sp. BN140010]MCW3797008.1 2'-5' RNA ligase family protein [Sphingomonas sp. BN140010]
MSALIVTAELASEDFAWLDGQRRRYFPPERNQLSAHLTMFHALPPSAEEEARCELKRQAARPAPRAQVAGLMNLGRGVAYRIVSDELEEVRRAIADHFHGSLTAQDGQGWRPHVTIMNKAEPRAARELLGELQASFHPRPLKISGLALHRYLGGPWEKLGAWTFRC